MTKINAATDILHGMMDLPFKILSTTAQEQAPVELERIVLAGLSRTSASCGAMEKAAPARGEARATLLRLSDSLDLREAVLVSTCSRFEIVACADEPAAAAEGLRERLAARAGLEAGSEAYVLRGRDAVRHLFRVASGLDSWILGESEILGQVKQAYAQALRWGCTGPDLNRIFQRAVAAGKDVRTRTGIQRGIHTIGGAAALVARRAFPDGARELVVFGAGQAAESVTRHLAERDGAAGALFERVTIANRTLEHARSLAGPLGAHAVGLEEGFARLAVADAAVFSVSSPQPLLNSCLRGLRSGGRGRLVVIDLGMPRNVEPDCKSCPGVELHDLDDLRRVMAEAAQGKAAEKEKAERLAASAADECCSELVRRSRRARGLETGERELSLIRGAR